MYQKKSVNRVYVGVNVRVRVGVRVRIKAQVDDRDIYQMVTRPGKKTS